MTRENSYATLDADGQVPLDQLDNAAGGGPHTHNASDIDAGALDDARVPAGVARDSEVVTAVSDHSADTSSVHGIADTTVLATDAEVATAVSDHAALANPHPTYLTQAEGDAAYEATGGVATHAGEADPHTGYVKENDANWTDLTDGGASTLHSHAAAGAPTDADYLVGTAHAGLSNEIAVGTTPGGELGGTWASPTVDVTHSGSTHGAAVTTHEGAADPHTGYRLESADHSHASAGLQGGTVAHTALTSVGIDDHHARDHAVNGSTHTGTLDDAQIPAGIARDAEVAVAYQPLDSDLTAIAALTTTAFGRSLLALADAAALGAAHTHSGASTLYAPGSFTTATGNFNLMADLLELTGVQVGTLEGTSVLRIV